MIKLMRRATAYSDNSSLEIWINPAQIFSVERAVGGALIRCEREHIYVTETPEQILALINNPFGNTPTPYFPDYRQPLGPGPIICGSGIPGDE
jgi:hypothetical protein